MQEIQLNDGSSVNVLTNTDINDCGTMKELMTRLPEYLPITTTNKNCLFLLPRPIVLQSRVTAEMLEDFETAQKKSEFDIAVQLNANDEQPLLWHMSSQTLYDIMPFLLRHQHDSYKTVRKNGVLETQYPPISEEDEGFFRHLLEKDEDDKQKYPDAELNMQVLHRVLIVSGFFLRNNISSLSHTHTLKTNRTRTKWISPPFASISTDILLNAWKVGHLPFVSDKVTLNKTNYRENPRRNTCSIWN